MTSKENPKPTPEQTENKIPTKVESKKSLRLKGGTEATSEASEKVEVEKQDGYPEPLRLRGGFTVMQIKSKPIDFCQKCIEKCNLEQVETKIKISDCIEIKEKLLEEQFFDNNGEKEQSEKKEQFIYPKVQNISDSSLNIKDKLQEVPQLMCGQIKDKNIEIDYELDKSRGQDPYKNILGSYTKTNGGEKKTMQNCENENRQLSDFRCIDLQKETGQIVQAWQIWQASQFGKQWHPQKEVKEKKGNLTGLAELLTNNK